MFERNVGTFERKHGGVWKGNSEEREREREERVFRRRVALGKDWHRRERRECVGSSKDKNRVMSCKGLNDTVLVRTFPPKGQNWLQCSHQNLGPGPFFFICEEFEHT